MPKGKDEGGNRFLCAVYFWGERGRTEEREESHVLQHISRQDKNCT